MKWPWKKEHRHDLKPIRVQHITAPNPMVPTVAVEATVVLYHCSCGLAQTHMLVGKWTMDDITGKTPTQTVDALIAASKEKPVA
jgi:hypothetical protein